MKKIIIAMLLILPMAVNAQKFGHINSQELFYQMPEISAVEDSIAKEREMYSNLLNEMQEEYKKKVQDYQTKQANMSEALRQINEEDIYNLQQRIQNTYQAAEQDIQQKQQQLLVPIHEKMAKAIKAVGEREGYTYIFDTAAMVHIGADAHDVTAAVKKELGIK